MTTWDVARQEHGPAWSLAQWALYWRGRRGFAARPPAQGFAVGLPPGVGGGGDSEEGSEEVDSKFVERGCAAPRAGRGAGRGGAQGGAGGRGGCKLGMLGPARPRNTPPPRPPPARARSGPAAFHKRAPDDRRVGIGDAQFARLLDAPWLDLGRGPLAAHLHPPQAVAECDLVRLSARHGGGGGRRREGGGGGGGGAGGGGAGETLHLSMGPQARARGAARPALPPARGPPLPTGRPAAARARRRRLVTLSPPQHALTHARRAATLTLRLRPAAPRSSRTCCAAAARSRCCRQRRPTARCSSRGRAARAGPRAS